MTEAMAMESVQGIVRKVVIDFCRCHRSVDPDEILGEAQLQALEAVRNYDEGWSTKLTSFVYYHVRHRLYWLWDRYPTWRARMAKRVFAYADIDVVRKRDFSVSSLLFEVSEEARQAILLALEQGPGRQGLTNEQRRKKLIASLKSIGWGWDQIVNVFREIREAL